MKMRKVIKKIVALGASALLGATMIASAANLSEYPAPFISDGKFSGMLVVGDKAAAEDVIGVSDIAMSLQFAATTSVGTATTSTIVEGDVWLVGTSSKKLEMSHNTDAANGVGNESIQSIMSSIDEDELDALADGSITTEKGTSGYNQYINFEDTAINGGFVQFMENDDDVAADFLYFKSGVQIARYSLEFKTSLQSDVEDSTGNKDTTGTFLGDFEDETITILGQEFTIVKARRGSSVGAGVELTLMGGAVKDTLNEGETKTYTIDGKEYEVTVVAITDTAPIIAKFNINGESTRSLSDGSSATLSDGTQIGISDIIPNEAGDVTQDLVEFYLGAAKVYLKDTNLGDSADTDSKDLEVGSEKIDDVNVIITGSDDNITFSIDTIELNITADDDYWVAAGHSLTEYMDEPQAFLGLWDIKYEGLSAVETEIIRVKTSGSDQYKLQFVDGDGNEVTVPLAYTSGGALLKLGDNDDDLILNETVVINKDDFLILSDCDGACSTNDGDHRTYALRYKGSDKVASGETAIVKFDNLGTGQRIEQTFRNSTGVDATLKLGGATFSIKGLDADESAGSSTASDNFDIYVDLDGNTNFGTNTEIAINTKAGLKITINDDANANTTALIFSTPNSNHYENVVPADVRLTISASGGEVAIAETSGDDIKWVAPSEENNVKYAYTSMGAKFKWDSPTSNPGQLTIEYPLEQRLPLVYITAGATKTVSGSAESVESVTINRIDVGATKLASEVADVAAQNLIIVGGPCANAVAAEVKGNPADCAAGYEAGKGLIELVDTGAENVALIVAGFSAADTRAATGVIANYADYELAGDAMEVVTATSVVKEVTMTTPAEEPADDDTVDADDDTTA